MPIDIPNDRRELAPFIDHTLLKPEATAADIDRLCDEARGHGFATVCVNPVWAARAVEHLAETTIGVTTVVGFPLGASRTATKVREAEGAIADGADELDMVLQIGRLRAGDVDAVRADIAAVVEVCRAGDALCKVILETALLDEHEIRRGCQAAIAAGADYVKTSTGFGPGGATEADVGLMRTVVGPDVGVKAAGGIRSAEDARRMLAAGASRLGASAGVAIVGG